jgi:FkbM family methyltransferase
MPLKALQRTVDRLSPSVSVQLRLLRKRLHQDMTLRVINRLVKPGDRVLDIGAYRGVYTLSLSQRVGRNGRVWSIEPFPPNVQALSRVAAGRLNVKVCAGAASDREGRQSLAVPVHRGHRLGALATLGEPSVHTERLEIDLVTVDRLLGAGTDQPPPVSFIRCDVVGHEAAVLAGAACTIGASLPSLFVEIEQRHRLDPIQSTFDRVTAYGYVGYFVKGKRLIALDQFDLTVDQLSFIRDEFVPYSLPRKYVHYFLFVRPGTDVRGIGSP